jgi:hypothetical protein
MSKKEEERKREVRRGRQGRRTCIEQRSEERRKSEVWTRLTSDAFVLFASSSEENF